MTTYNFDLDAINAIAILAGGTGGHEFIIDALNDWAESVGGAGGHKFVIDAVNEIAVESGGAGGHSYYIDALNNIVTASGGAGTYDFSIDALNELAVLLSVAAPARVYFNSSKDGDVYLRSAGVALDAAVGKKFTIVIRGRMRRKYSVTQSMFRFGNARGHITLELHPNQHWLASPKVTLKTDSGANGVNAYVVQSVIDFRVNPDDDDILLISVDGSLSFADGFRCKMLRGGEGGYLYDAEPAAATAWTGADIHFTSTTEGVYALGYSNIVTPNFELAYLWASPHVFFDFDDPAEVAKFFAAAIGADGSGPTGAAPTVFLTGESGAAAFIAGTANLGTLGAMTATVGTGCEITDDVWQDDLAPVDPPVPAMADYLTPPDSGWAVLLADDYERTYRADLASGGDLNEVGAITFNGGVNAGDIYGEQWNQLSRPQLNPYTGEREFCTKIEGYSYNVAQNYLWKIAVDPNNRGRYTSTPRVRINGDLDTAHSTNVRCSVLLDADGAVIDAWVVDQGSSAFVSTPAITLDSVPQVTAAVLTATLAPVGGVTITVPQEYSPVTFINQGSGGALEIKARLLTEAERTPYNIPWGAIGYCFQGYGGHAYMEHTEHVARWYSTVPMPAGKKTIHGHFGAQWFRSTNTTQLGTPPNTYRDRYSEQDTIETLGSIPDSLFVSYHSYNGGTNNDTNISHYRPIRGVGYTELIGRGHLFEQSWDGVEVDSLLDGIHYVGNGETSTFPLPSTHVETVEQAAFSLHSFVYQMSLHNRDEWVANSLDHSTDWDNMKQTLHWLVIFVPIRSIYPAVGVLPYDYDVYADGSSDVYTS